MRAAHPTLRLTARRAALALLLLVLASSSCRPAGPADPTAAGSAAPAAAPASSGSAEQPPGLITIRNATKTTLTYEILSPSTGEAESTRTIAPGVVHTFPDGQPLTVAFKRRDERFKQQLVPGKHYTFRTNAAGEMLWLYRGATGRPDAQDLAPYVPSPMPVVDKMLELAEVGPDDVVYDIGCGDGRIVIRAAQKYGARGVGIDIDPERIAESYENARRAGVTDRVEFRLEDATKSNISDATVVTLYLLPVSNSIIRPLLEQQLRPGARIVAHTFQVGLWKERQVAEQSVMDEKGGEHTIFLYRK